MKTASRFLWQSAAMAAVFATGFLAGHQSGEAATKRVFELRTYTANDGKLDDLLARFRNHTVKIFDKHGMTSIGYWVPKDAPLKDNTLIYLLAHESREAAEKSWDAFRKDPEWIKARDASEVNGKLTKQVVSVFMDPTDFSKIR